jgi:hypothetical protein
MKATTEWRKLDQTLFVRFPTNLNSGFTTCHEGSGAHLIYAKNIISDLRCYLKCFELLPH